MDQRQLGGLGGLLRPAAWDSMVGDGTVRRFEAGTVMMRQGEQGRFVLALTAGRVKVTRDESNGSQLLLGLRGPGEVLGDISVLDGRPRSATVTAVDDCETAALSARRFGDLMRSHDFTETLLRHTLSRLRDGEDRWAEKATLPAGRLVARFLHRLAFPAGVPASGPIAIDIRLSQEDLARAVGLSRSAVAAELQRLRTLGVVSTARRHLVIRDPGRLDLLASADGRLAARHGADARESG